METSFGRLVSWLNNDDLDDLVGRDPGDPWIDVRPRLDLPRRAPRFPGIRLLDPSTPPPSQGPAEEPPPFRLDLPGPTTMTEVAEQTLALSETLRCEDLAVRLTECHRSLVQFGEQWRFMDDSAWSLKTSIAKLESELRQLREEDLPLIDREKDDLVSAKDRVEANLAVARIVQQDWDGLSARDYDWRPHLKIMANASYHAVPESAYTDDANRVGGSNLRQKAITAQTEYAGADVDLRKLQAKTAAREAGFRCSDLFERKTEFQNRIDKLEIRRRALGRQENRLELDLRNLSRRWSTFAGESLPARLTALIAAGRQELATFTALCDQLAKALGNVYDGLVAREAVEALEDASSASAIDDPKIVEATATLRYLDEFFARIRSRSARGVHSRAVKLDRVEAAGPRYSAVVRVTTDMFAGFPLNLPRLRGCSLITEAGLVGKAWAALEVSRSGSRFPSLGAVSREIDQRSAWPVILGRTVAPGLEHETMIFGQAALWNCSLYSDYKLVMHLDGITEEEAPETLTAELVLHYEHIG